MTGPSSSHRLHLAVAALGAAALIGSACKIDIDTGKTATETFEVSAFDEVEIDSSFDVEIVVGPEPSLEIDVHEEALDRLEVDQDGDRLTIGFSGGLFSISGKQDVRITTPSLEAVKLDGAVSADITGLDGERLELDLDGASFVTGSGSVGVVVIDADGASRIDLADLAIDRVEVDANGASSIDVSDAAEVSGELGGASSLDVADDAVVDVDESGSSSIN